MASHVQSDMDRPGGEASAMAGLVNIIAHNNIKSSYRDVDDTPHAVGTRYAGIVPHHLKVNETKGADENSNIHLNYVTTVVNNKHIFVCSDNNDKIYKSATDHPEEGESSNPALIGVEKHETNSCNNIFCEKAIHTVRYNTKNVGNVGSTIAVSGDNTSPTLAGVTSKVSGGPKDNTNSDRAVADSSDSTLNKQTPESSNVSGGKEPATPGGAGIVATSHKPTAETHIKEKYRDTYSYTGSSSEPHIKGPVQQGKRHRQTSKSSDAPTEYRDTLNAKDQQYRRLAEPCGTNTTSEYRATPTASDQECLHLADQGGTNTTIEYRATPAASEQRYLHLADQGGTNTTVEYRDTPTTDDQQCPHLADPGEYNNTTEYRDTHATEDQQCHLAVPRGTHLQDQAEYSDCHPHTQGATSNINEYRDTHPISDYQPYNQGGVDKRHPMNIEINYGTSTGINTSGSLIPNAWEELLPIDLPDREFLMSGIKEGFRITNSNPDRALNGDPVWCTNYNSVMDQSMRPIIEAQIKEEIDNGRYKVVDKPPNLVSSLGAVPKKDSDKYRLIHDCSRPLGKALNDFAVSTPFAYQTIDHAIDLIKPQFLLAKIDLSSAYRSVKIHPDDEQLTGLSWEFEGSKKVTYMIDTRLPFGARMSPFIFNSLTQAVRKIMEREGHMVVAYLDDFLCIGKDAAQCQKTMIRLWRLLRELGFAINYRKLEGPRKRIIFLGIGMDTANMTLFLAEDKLTALKADLTNIQNRTRATKRMYQSLAGKLNWACRVIYGGRTFLRRILDIIKTIREQGHTAKVNKDVREDIQWWLNYLDGFNGTMGMIEDRACAPVTIDACNKAAGGVFGDAFFHLPWDRWPGTSNHHINIKEVLALEPAAFLWGRKWANKHIYVHSDNQCAVAIINKGTNANTDVMLSLRRVFWWSIEFNFRITAVYYPGERNILADLASRLTEPKAAEKLFTILQSSNCYRDPESGTRGGGGTVPRAVLCGDHTEDLQITKEDVSDLLPPNEHSTSTSKRDNHMPIRSLPGTQVPIFVDKAIPHSSAQRTPGGGTAEPYEQQVQTGIDNERYQTRVGRQNNQEAANNTGTAQNHSGTPRLRHTKRRSLLGSCTMHVLRPAEAIERTV